MGTRPVLLVLAALAAGCAHRAPNPAADDAVEVHGRIVTDGEPARGAPRPPALAAWWAYLPMVGRCGGSGCLRDGWRAASQAGKYVTTCERGDCGKDGWTTQLPDGTAARTRCSPGSCFRDGWTTRHDDGTAVEVRCAFGDCLKDGWTATDPDGRTAVARCNFSDCAREGFTLSIDGQAEAIRCRCEFGDCAEHGAVCR